MAKKRATKRARPKAQAKPDFPDFVLPPEPAVPTVPTSDRAVWQAYARDCLARSERVRALVQEHCSGRLSAAAAREPLDFRAQHGAVSDDRGPVIERTTRQIPDVEGRPGHPFRAYDTLATLHRNGSIDADELTAGRQFEEAFRLAGLDPLHAANPARIPGASRGDLNDAMVAGRERVARSMAALGGYASPAGTCLWWVLGCGQTIKEFAKSTQFGGGRSLDEKVAKGVLYP